MRASIAALECARWSVRSCRRVGAVVVTSCDSARLARAAASFASSVSLKAQRHNRSSAFSSSAASPPSSATAFRAVVDVASARSRAVDGDGARHDPR
jgi:hypothetical protein